MYKKSYKMILKQKLTSLKNAQISFLWSKRAKANTVSVNEQLPEVERPFLISVSELRDTQKWNIFNAIYCVKNVIAPTHPDNLSI